MSYAGGDGFVPMDDRRSDMLKLVLYDLNSAIAPVDHRMEALSTAIAEFDHEEDEKHDEELDLHADKILFQKLAFAFRVDRSSEEVALICTALEMVYRASRPRVALSFTELRESVLPMFVELLGKPVYLRKQEALQKAMERNEQNEVEREQEEQYEQLERERSWKVAKEAAPPKPEPEPEPSLAPEEEEEEEAGIPAKQLYDDMTAYNSKDARYQDDERTYSTYEIEQAGYAADAAVSAAHGSSFSDGQPPQDGGDAKQVYDPTLDGDDANGYDELNTQYGYDKSGFDQAGYDQGAYDQTVYDQSDYDQGGYYQGGYDQGGYPDDPNASGQSLELDKKPVTKSTDNKVGKKLSQQTSDLESVVEERVEGMQEQANNEGAEEYKEGYDEEGTYQEEGGVLKKGQSDKTIGATNTEGNQYDESGYDQNYYDQAGYAQSGYDDQTAYDQSWEGYEGYDPNQAYPDQYGAEGKYDDQTQWTADQQTQYTGGTEYTEGYDGQYAEGEQYGQQYGEEYGQSGYYDQDQQYDQSGYGQGDYGQPHYDQSTYDQSEYPKEQYDGQYGQQYDNEAADQEGQTGTDDSSLQYTVDEEGNTGQPQTGGAGIEVETVEDDGADTIGDTVYDDPKKEKASFGSGYSQMYPDNTTLGDNQTYASLEHETTFESGYSEAQPEKKAAVEKEQPYQGQDQQSTYESIYSESYRDDTVADGLTTIGEETEVTQTTVEDDSVGKTKKGEAAPAPATTAATAATTGDAATTVGSRSIAARTLKAKRKKAESEVSQEISRLETELAMIRIDDPTNPVGISRSLQVLRYFSRVLSAMVPMAHHPGLLDALVYQLERQPYGKHSSHFIEYFDGEPRPPEEQQELASARVDAIATIVNLACAEENKAKMATHPGLIDAITAVAMNDPSEEAREHAAIVIMNLAYEDENKEKMVEHPNMLETLVSLIQDDSPFTRRYASAAMFTLACVVGNTERMASYCDGEILECLRRVLADDPVDEARINASEALFNMARNNTDETVQMMGEHPRLMATLAKAVLTDYSADVRVYCARALEWMSADVHFPMDCHSLLLSALTVSAQWTKTSCIAEAMKTQALMEENRFPMAAHDGLLQALSNLALLEALTDSDVRKSAVAALEMISREPRARPYMVKNEQVMQALTKASFERGDSYEFEMDYDDGNVTGKMIKVALQNLSSHL